DVGQEEDLVLHLEAGGLPVEDGHLRRLHEAGATIALSRGEQHEHLYVAEERQAERQAAVRPPRAWIASERPQRADETAVADGGVKVGRERARRRQTGNEAARLEQVGRLERRELPREQLLLETPVVVRQEVHVEVQSHALEERFRH